MAVKRSHRESVYELSVLVCFCLCVHASQSINLGLIAGDLKRSGSPLIVRKVSHNAPVYININSGLPNLPSLAALPPVPLPKLPTKPPPGTADSKSSIRRTRSPFPPLLPLLPPPILLPPIFPPLLPPVIPKVPLLPIVPPILHPLPLSPLLPSPLLGTPKFPLIPPINPLRVPILGRTPLQKALRTAKLLRPRNANRRTALPNILDLKRKRLLKTPNILQSL